MEAFEELSDVEGGEQACSRDNSDFSEDELLAMPYYMNTRAASIYAGSNEVQRSLLAKAVMAG